MAKYERKINGDFDSLLGKVHDDITSGSVSVSYEDGGDVSMNGTRVAVRIYERYSALGGNRVSMNVTIAGNGEDLYLCAITSGGSQAVFFKINTFGEEAFLRICEKSVEEFLREQ